MSSGAPPERLNCTQTAGADAPDVLQPSEDRVTQDHEGEQLRNLLHKVTERCRVAEESAEAALRELESVRAALAQERASSALLGEMAGEAERRAMKAEATNEAQRAHLSGLPPVSSVAAVVAGGGRVPGQPARQVLDGLVRELSAPAAAVVEPVVVEPAVTPVVEPVVAVVEPQPEPEVVLAVVEQLVPVAPRARQGTAQRGSVTVLPGASSRRRWSR